MKRIWTLILMLVTLALAAWLQPHGVSFAGFELSMAFGVLTLLFVIAVFLERALDVLLTLWRGPQSQVLQRELSHLKEDDAENVTAIRAAEKAISDYKTDTRGLAMKLGYVLGFIVALVGIRCLEPLVAADVLAGLSGLQQGAFRVVDVLITGGLLAGGSDGIHKITELLRDVKIVTQNEK